MPKSKLAELIASASVEELSELGITPAAQAAALQGARDAKKLKKVPTTRKVKKVFDASLSHPPAGFRWVYNRLSEPFERMFDGMVYSFDGHEYRLVTLDVARFLWSRSIISYNPTTNRGLRALALDPFSDDKLEPNEDTGFGEPLANPKNVELVDRSQDDNPLGVGTRGEKTHAAVISVNQPGGTTLPR